MVFSFTDVVVTSKLANVLPAVITTLAGTAAFAGLLLIIVTTTPPAGAGPVRFTIPTDVEPPAIVEGASVTDESITGIAAFNVMVVDLFTAEKLAVMLPAVGNANPQRIDREIYRGKSRRNCYRRGHCRRRICARKNYNGSPKPAPHPSL